MHNCLGPDDGYGVKNARIATIEPNEQGAVGPTQMQSAWCAPDEVQSEFAEKVGYSDGIVTSLYQ